MIRKIKERLRGKTFLINVSKMMSGMLVGQLAILIFSPFLTKIYSPGQFGLFGLFQSIVATVWVVGTLRYDLAIPIADTEKESNALTSLTIFFSFSFSLLALVFILGFVYFGGEEVYSYLGHIIWLIPLGILVISAFYIFNFFLIRHKEFTTISMSKGVRGMSMGGYQYLLGLIYPSAIMLVVGYVAGYVMAVLVQVRKVFSYPGIPVPEKINIGGAKKILRKYKEFPQYSVFSSFTNIASTQVPIVLLAGLYSTEIAGFFFLAQRILGMPINLLATSIAEVFFGASGKMIKEDPKSVLKLFKKVVFVMLGIGIIPMLVIIFQGEWIFGFVFGEKWKAAGKVAGILTIMYFARMVTTPLSLTLVLLKKLNVQLIWDVLRLLSLIALFWMCKFYKVPYSDFLLFFSLLMSVMYIAHGLLSYYFLQDRVRFASMENKNK